MKLTSSAFENNGTIPVRFTCEGENVSPPLSWTGVPEGARVLALIVDDPDAPGRTFSHWVVYNIPLTPTHLEEGATLSERFAQGLREGRNDFGRQGYGGPCPPVGDSPHRYYFRLYALNQALDLAGSVTRGQLFDEMEGKSIEEAVLVGRFSR